LHRKCFDGAPVAGNRRRRPGHKAECATAGERRGRRWISGKWKLKKARRPSGPRHICATTARRLFVLEERLARRCHRGDAKRSESHLCRPREIRAKRGAVDGIFDQRGRRRSSGRAGDISGGHAARKFKDGPSFVHRTRAIVARRFREWKRIRSRLLRDSAGHEMRRGMSCRIPQPRRSRSVRRWRASRFEEGALWHVTAATLKT